MDIRQIELFIAAAEEQHFTRAAKRMHIVQSGLSVAIRALEEELGASLFVRNTRRVELSEAGRNFLPEARRVLLATKAARDAVAAVRGGLTGRLSIGTTQSLPALLDLPMLLQEFHKRHPNVVITVREGYPEALAEPLRKGTLDLAFMPLSGAPRSGFLLDRLFASPMVITVSPEHRLARRAEVRLTELSEEVFVDFSPRWGTRQLVDQIFALERVARHTEFELENVELLLQFVARGFGIAAVPQSMVEGRRLSHLAIVPKRKSNVLPHWEIGMFRAKTQSQLSPNPPAETFRTMIFEAFGGKRGGLRYRSCRRNEAQRRVARGHRLKRWKL
jgi:DNA-binding transcriptional LysR family regulator